MAVRENVPRPEYAAGQRRCKRRLDGGGGVAKVTPPFSKGDAHSNRLHNDVMVYCLWEPKFPFKPIFSKHLYFSSSKLWYPPKSLEKPQKSDYLQTILIQPDVLWIQVYMSRTWAASWNLSSASLSSLENQRRKPNNCSWRVVEGTIGDSETLFKADDNLSAESDTDSGTVRGVILSIWAQRCGGIAISGHRHLSETARPCRFRASILPLLVFWTQKSLFLLWAGYCYCRIVFCVRTTIPQSFGRLCSCRQAFTWEDRIQKTCCFWDGNIHRSLHRCPSLLHRKDRSNRNVSEPI